MARIDEYPNDPAPTGDDLVLTVDVGTNSTKTAKIKDVFGAGDESIANLIEDPSSEVSTALTSQFAPVGIQAPGSTIVWFGDSYIDRSGTQSYADDANRDATGPAMWCEALLYGRLSPLANAGANGETTAQFLARIDDVTALSPKIVGLLTAGLNDVKGAVTSATTIANLTTIFDTLIGAGSIVVTSTIPPSDLINTSDEIAALFAVNRWLMNEAITRPGLVVVDCYSLLALSSTVDWRSEYDNDGTHPNARGAYVIGKAFASAIDRIIPQATANVVRSDADPDEIMPNPTMSGTGGSGTGVIPASVTQTGGTGTGTKVARTDGIPGDWFYWDQSTGTNTILQNTTTGFATGDRLQAQVELHVDAADWSPTSYYVYVEQRTAANAVINSVETYLAANGDVPLHDPIVVRVNPLTVDATAASVRVAIRQVGAGICRVGLMSLRNLG